MADLNSTTISGIVNRLSVKSDSFATFALHSFDDDGRAFKMPCVASNGLAKKVAEAGDGTRIKMIGRLKWNAWGAEDAKRFDLQLHALSVELPNDSQLSIQEAA